MRFDRDFLFFRFFSVDADVDEDLRFFFLLLSLRFFEDVEDEEDFFLDFDDFFFRFLSDDVDEEEGDDFLDFFGTSFGTFTSAAASDFVFSTSNSTLVAAVSSAIGDLAVTTCVCA